MPTIEDLLREGYSHWDDAESLSRVGCELQSRCRFEDAEALLTRALDLDPKNTTAWENLSYVQFRSLRYAEGRATLQRGIDATESDELKSILLSFSSPEDGTKLEADLANTTDVVARAVLLVRRFYAAEEDAERRATLEDLRSLAEAHPESEGVQSQLLWALLGGCNLGVVEADLLHKQGLPAAWARAKAKPDSMSPWWLLLQLASSLKDWQTVLEGSAEALAQMPDEETVLQLRGRAYRELGDTKRSEQCFLRAIGAKPSFAGARTDLGRLYEARGELELAEDVFREIPVANPDYALAPISLALFLTRQEQLDEAESVLIEAWPRVPEMFRPSIMNNAEAKPLLARPRVKDLLESSATRES